MITPDAGPAALSSPDLLAALDGTAARGREVTAELVALLAQCDARQLYATEGYPSLFEFCVARLRLSESQAYHRIQAARAVQCLPLVLERLRAGRISLTAVALLREHLTQANHREVLDWADGRRKREVEMFLRSLDPRPDSTSSLRRLAPPRRSAPSAVAAERATCETAEVFSPSGVSRVPPVAGVSSLGVRSAETVLPLVALPATTPPPEGQWHARQPSTQVGELVPGNTAAPEAHAPSPAPLLAGPALGTYRESRPEVRPTAPGRYSLRVTISQETADKLRRAQALLAHALPAADAAVVLDRALTLLLAQLERRKAGAPRKPRRRACAAGPKPAKTARLDTASPPAVPDVSGPRLPVEAPCPAATESVALASPRPPDTATRPHRRSRYIPAAVRRAVWDRDGGCCAYVSSSGTRCTATAALEFHHRIPFAEGGASTTDNISLACGRHNRVEADRWFNFDRTEFGVAESGRRGV